MATNLTLSLSPDAARELLRKYEAGELREIAGIAVLSIERVTLDELYAEQDYLLGAKLAGSMTCAYGLDAMVRDCTDVAEYAYRREPLPGACAEIDAGAFVRGYLDEALWIVSAQEVIDNGKNG